MEFCGFLPYSLQLPNTAQLFFIFLTWINFLMKKIGDTVITQ